MTEAEWLACDDPQRMLDNLLGQDPQRSLDLLPIGPTPSDRKLRLFACAVTRQCLTGNCIITAQDLETAERFADGAASLDELTQARISSDLWCCSHEAIRGAEECARIVPEKPDVSWAALLRDICGNPFRPVRCNECYRGRVPTDRDDDTCEVCGGTGGLPQRWLTPTVLGLAQAAYDERGTACKRCKGRRWISRRTPDDVGFGRASRTDPCPDCHGTGRLDPFRLPILADALEDAGCDNTEILRHCRGMERCWECNGTLAVGDDSGGNVGRVRHCDCRTGWCPLRGPHVRGCWVLDLLLGKE